MSSRSGLRRRPALPLEKTDPGDAMKRQQAKRRGFADPPYGIMISMMLVGLAIGTALPFVKAARSAGWSWWSAASFVPLSLFAAVTYLLGIPYAASRIGRLLDRSQKDASEVWFGVLLATTWLTGIALFMVLGFTADWWFVP